MTLSLVHALILGALQGVAELFPISSLAQTILLPALLQWDMPDPKNSDFLSFIVALHLATAVALVIYFWKDWRSVFLAYLGSLQRRKLVYDEASKFAWLLVAGSIIVGLAGLLLEKRLKALFEDQKKAWIVALVLIINGIMMLLADLIKKQLSAAPESSSSPDTPAPISPDSDPATDSPGQKRKAEDLTVIEATAIGATQSLALVPGISRSGVSIVAGLLAGLSYEQASRFSFMLGTVAIGLAAVKKVPALFKPEARHFLGITIAAAVLSGITAYLSTRFLMHYFRHHRLAPFGWFCIIFGAYAVWVLRH